MRNEIYAAFKHDKAYTHARCANDNNKNNKSVYVAINVYFFWNMSVYTYVHSDNYCCMLKSIFRRYCAYTLCNSSQVAPLCGFVNEGALVFYEVIFLLIFYSFWIFVYFFYFYLKQFCCEKATTEFLKKFAKILKFGI